MRLWVVIAGLVLCAPALAPPLCAQQSGPWTLRFGATGTGTFDEGTIFFHESMGLGPQTFEFSNSWGAALNVDRALSRRLRLGAHAAYAATDFELRVTPPGDGLHTDGGRTNLVPLLVELKLALLPDRRVNPHVGVAGGLTMARPVRLTPVPSAAPDDFEFETRGIVGYVVGLDVVLDRDARWLAFFQIKSLGLTYSLKPNSLVPGQVLLDQSVKDALNHLVLGVGVRP